MDDSRVVEVFERERPHLLGLGYRLLGSIADAEDIVQETWLRWQAADRSGIERPEAWLTAVCSRVGLDQLRRRQRDRTDYVGPWLPEPLGVSLEPEPGVAAELSDSLTTSFLVLLERLDPEERLGILMVDVFGEPFSRVAELVGKNSAACRQMVSRARRKLRLEHPSTPLDRRDVALDVARRLAQAVVLGDVQAVSRLLAPEVVLLSDGGARRHAARRPVVLPERVSRLLVNVGRKVVNWPTPLTLSEVILNGSPGLVARNASGRPVHAHAVDVTDGLVVRIHIFANPTKLAALDRRIDLR